MRSKPRRTYDSYKVDFSSEGEHIPYLIKRLLAQKVSRSSFLAFMREFGQESGLFETISVKEFGKDSVAPFELNVVLGGHPLRVSDVGYGVSQSLPIIVEIFAKSRGHRFAIQQPEVHLHPRAQAALGEVISQMALNEDKVFFVETHSDYLIDRFRLSYRGKGEKQLAAQVLFFERDQTENRVYPIEIMQDGTYSDDQPQAFREFFIHEALKLLGL